LRTFARGPPHPPHRTTHTQKPPIHTGGMPLSRCPRPRTQCGSPPPRTALTRCRMYLHRGRVTRYGLAASMHALDYGPREIKYEVRRLSAGPGQATRRLQWGEHPARASEDHGATVVPIPLSHVTACILPCPPHGLVSAPCADVALASCSRPHPPSRQSARRAERAPCCRTHPDVLLRSHPARRSRCSASAQCADIAGAPLRRQSARSSEGDRAVACP
jgi:hypothetical protein